MTPVHHVDSMGLHFLEDLVFTTRAKGIKLLVANPNHMVSSLCLMSTLRSFVIINLCPAHKRQVVNSWSRVKLPQLIGKENIFVSTHEAMAYAKASRISVCLTYPNLLLHFGSKYKDIDMLVSSDRCVMSSLCDFQIRLAEMGHRPTLVTHEASILPGYQPRIEDKEDL